MKNRNFTLAFVVSLFLTSATSLCAKTEGRVINRTGCSNSELFNTGWKFMRYGLQPEGTRIEEPEGLENPELNDSDWRNLDLPHDWAIEGPFRIEIAGEAGKLPYKAIGWYRKHFDLPKSNANKRIYIDFDGAMAYAEIWCNGNYVGTWPFGYNSFRMDLTPFCKFGEENVIAVKLNTEKFDARWYSGGGIYRNVWLVKTEPVHVAHWGTFMTTPYITSENASLNLAVEIENNSGKKADTLIKTTVYEFGADDKIGKKVCDMDDATLTIADGKTSDVNIKGNISNPKLWDVDAPNRYIAISKVMVDGKTVDLYYTTFGVRTLEFTPHNGFLLNGRRIDIKGTCNHHDLGALGAAFNKSALTRQFKILQEMGCNALRCSHNPPAVEFLDLADKMGFLVCDEAFDTWKGAKRENDFHVLYDDWHEKDMIAMVRRDRNHPSVIMWSIGNEVIEQHDPEMTKHLADIVKKIDTTRPTTEGFNDPTGGYKSGAAEGIDVMGLNYYFEQEEEWHKDPRYANKPSVGTETVSAVSSRGFYMFDNERDDRSTWQVSSYDSRGWDLHMSGWQNPPDAQFNVHHRNPELLGEFVWTGFDYLGEPTPYNSDETNLLNYRTDPEKMAELAKVLEDLRKNNPPSRSSYFGIVDLAGFPKDRYYLYQAHWRPELPMVHILPHWNWPERVGMKVPVHVYTSGDEAELFLNGKSLGRQKKIPGYDFRLIWEDVIYEPGVLEVVAYKDGVEWAKGEMRTTESASNINLSADRNEIESSSDDLAYITAVIADKNGLTVPRSNPTIKFSIEGPGEIVATDNGDATSFESFQSPERKAFNGMALVIVKAKQGAKGKFSVKAESEGLSSEPIVINISK